MISLQSSFVLFQIQKPLFDQNLKFVLALIIFILQAVIFYVL